MRSMSALVLAALAFVAAPSTAHAQVIGTFYWQLGAGNLGPTGSVVNITITQKGSLYILEGFEAQCGGNLSLPLTGVGIPQANGTIFLGFTSINETGSGLHTRAYLNVNTLGGTWADNTGYFNQPFTFRPNGAPVCPGNLRTGAGTPDQRPGGQ